jgi:hypothetical protein
MVSKASRVSFYGESSATRWFENRSAPSIGPQWRALAARTRQDMGQLRVQCRNTQRVAH